MPVHAYRLVILSLMLGMKVSDRIFVAAITIALRYSLVMLVLARIVVEANSDLKAFINLLQPHMIFLFRRSLRLWHVRLWRLIFIDKAIILIIFILCHLHSFVVCLCLITGISSSTSSLRDVSLQSAVGEAWRSVHPRS